MKDNTLLPHLFRTEYRKITAVLGKLFGWEHIEIAEDIASDTFLYASETWGLKGIPENPTAWLYAVAKNKAKDYLKRNDLFHQKIQKEIRASNEPRWEVEVDLSPQNMTDSQLQMIFAICHPAIATESQIGLALRILCGFGIEEIANAFLTNKEAINKRLFRAKETLRKEKVRIEVPPTVEIKDRLETVLTTLYLLFNEGYYSSSKDYSLRKDLCLEAMRLTHLLTEYAATNQPNVNALLALMCFHASRFDARMNQEGGIVRYQEQDATLWNTDLMQKGNYYLLKGAQGGEPSKYHLEAALAYWHTFQKDTAEKWNTILQIYNQLLIIEYSPMAALNRTYALFKVQGNKIAILEAEKLRLDGNYFYHSLLGELYKDLDNNKAMEHLLKALSLSKSEADKALIANKLKHCQGGNTV